MVTLMPRLPLSANNWAMLLSKTKQSEPIMAEATPSWLERGIASHVKRRRLPFSSKLKKDKWSQQNLTHNFGKISIKSHLPRHLWGIHTKNGIGSWKEVQRTRRQKGIANIKFKKQKILRNKECFLQCLIIRLANSS